MKVPPAKHSQCAICNKDFFGGLDADSAIVKEDSCKENAWWKSAHHMENEHSDKMMLCPRRSESGFALTKSDYWDKDGTCSYCGSLSPERLFAAIEAGQNIGSTDKNYKIYVGNGNKFYFQHLSADEQKKFIDLYNAKRISMRYGFYVMPYFCAVV